jgi:hypothetical protein
MVGMVFRVDEVGQIHQHATCCAPVLPLVDSEVAFGHCGLSRVQMDRLIGLQSQQRAGNRESADRAPEDDLGFLHWL